MTFVFKTLTILTFFRMTLQSVGGDTYVEVHFQHGEYDHDGAQYGPMSLVPPNI